MPIIDEAAFAAQQQQHMTEDNAFCFAPPEALPAGFLRCTCEKYPRVLHASQGMLELLGMTWDSEDWREMICDNLFFMVPFEERRIFRNYLDATLQSAEPVSVEHHVIHGDGTLKLLTGWMAIVETEQGRELHLLYIKPPRQQTERLREKAYRRILAGVYDAILEIDRTRGTIECIHQTEESLRLAWPSVAGAADAPVHVSQEDYKAMGLFLEQLKRGGDESDSPLRLIFHVSGSKGLQTCEAVAVELDPRTALLCCRCLTDTTCQQESEGVNPETPKVSIRTFGYFDVFVDGKPVVFRYEKSKELLAVLVDREGSFVSNPYIINCLWEDEPYNEKIQNRCRQTAHRMMQTLKEYGIQYIIEQINGKRRIVPERVQCDYFDYMRGDRQTGRKFNGAYLSDYSWGEMTLSNLMKDAEGNPGRQE